MPYMVAAQKFNEINNIAIATIYGSVSSGTAWRLTNIHDFTCCLAVFAAISLLYKSGSVDCSG
jgi:hypothetical protein